MAATLPVSATAQHWAAEVQHAELLTGLSLKPMCTFTSVLSCHESIIYTEIRDKYQLRGAHVGC